MAVELQRAGEVVYPDCDGNPIADNTLQFEWIVTIKDGLEDLFRDDPNVFVAGDLLWYPVEGDNRTRIAPDAMAAFGRPKGYRGSYMQWREDDIAPQAVFEVLSPGNRYGEMRRKRAFYETFGVEEYYVFDPYRNELDGWQRKNDQFVPIEAIDGWISPRLGICFDLSQRELLILRPDGRRFLTFVELSEQRDREEQRAEQAEQRAGQAEHRAALLAARLRALGIDPDSEQ